MSAGVDAWSAPAVSAPYNAATINGRLRRWRPTSSGPNAVVAASAGTLVQRSRDAKRNNPIAKKALDLLVTHIVGAGIRPRSLCPNKGVQKQITAAWDAWTKVSDADRVLDFYGQQMQAVSEMLTAGEVYARMRARYLTDGLPVPLQIQMIPAEQVPVAKTTMNGTNSVVQGIERDVIGNRVAYWMYPQHPSDPAPLQGSNEPAPVDANDVCHLFDATNRTGQLRGLPWLTAALTTLHQVNDYLDAELVRKQCAAMLVSFMIQDIGEGDIGPADVAGLQEGLGGLLPEVAMEPGAVNVLPPGKKMQFNEPADVGASFDPFLRAEYRAASAAVGTMYSELTGDWTDMNDRTYRAAFNTFKRQMTAIQYNLVVVQFCDPIWQRFIDYAVAAGKLKVPKSLSDADLRKVFWSPDRWAYINPLQDVQATGIEIALGLNSRQAAVAERGDDVETIDEQQIADRAREKASGLSYGVSSKGDVPPMHETSAAGA